MSLTPAPPGPRLPATMSADDWVTAIAEALRAAAIRVAVYPDHSGRYLPATTPQSGCWDTRLTVDAAGFAELHRWADRSAPADLARTLAGLLTAVTAPDASPDRSDG